MGRILRTIPGKGSLANLMLVIGFGYKGTLLIEEFSYTFANTDRSSLRKAELTPRQPTHFIDACSTRNPVIATQTAAAQ